MQQEHFKVYFMLKKSYELHYRTIYILNYIFISMSFLGQNPVILITFF